MCLSFNMFEKSTEWLNLNKIDQILNIDQQCQCEKVMSSRLKSNQTLQGHTSLCYSWNPHERARLNAISWIRSEMLDAADPWNPWLLSLGWSHTHRETSCANLWKLWLEGCPGGFRQLHAMVRSWPHIITTLCHIGSILASFYNPAWHHIDIILIHIMPLTSWNHPVAPAPSSVWKRLFPVAKVVFPCGLTNGIIWHQYMDHMASLHLCYLYAICWYRLFQTDSELLFGAPSWWHVLTKNDLQLLATKLSAAGHLGDLCFPTCNLLEGLLHGEA